MQKDPTSRLKVGQLAELLKLGGDHQLPDDPAAQDQLTAELLRERLADPLPLDTTVLAGLPAMAGGIRPAPGQGRTLGEALLDPATSLETIRRVKNYAKDLGRREQNRPGRGPEHAAALAVYYAAIAGALVFRDERITSHSREALIDSFGSLIDKPWMVPELAELFEKARGACTAEAE